MVLGPHGCWRASPPPASRVPPTALQGLADRTGLMTLTRFVVGIVVAVECVTVSTGPTTCWRLGRAVSLGF